MSSPAREFFTLDLRGLRAGLRERAASQGLTESAVVRGILAAALGPNAAIACAVSRCSRSHERSSGQAIRSTAEDSVFSAGP